MEKNLIKSQRKLKGFSQYELAAKTGWKIKQPEISLFERGLIKLTNEKVELLAKVLEIDKSKLSEDCYE